MNVDWRQVRYVALAGALGGFLCWVYSEAVGTPLELGRVGSPLASVALGTGAALLGVYLVAKTDMSATLHALAFAMACGFAWRPVLEGAGALVEAQLFQADQKEIAKSAGEADEASGELDGAQGREAQEAFETAVDATIRALSYEARTTSLALHRSVRLEGVVSDLSAARGLDVGKQIDGLQAIADAATAAGDETLAFECAAAIEELGTSERANPRDKKAAAAAVGRIGELGALRRMPGLAVNSDLLQEGIGSRGDTPVREVIDRNRRLRPR